MGWLHHAVGDPDGALRLRRRHAVWNDRNRTALHGLKLVAVAAALYNPLWTTSVKTPGDFGVALVGFILLKVWRLPPLVVVIASAFGGAALSTIGSHS